jgi:5-methylcytosine-specific restriction endonuclease McrA
MRAKPVTWGNSHELSQTKPESFTQHPSHETRMAPPLRGPGIGASRQKQQGTRKKNKHMELGKRWSLTVKHLGTFLGCLRRAWIRIARLTSALLLRSRDGGRRRGVDPRLRARVWRTYHQEKENGQCYCCGDQIGRSKAWHCAHVTARAAGGEDSLENLRTCCAACNLSMGRLNLYEFIARRKLKGPGSKILNNKIHTRQCRVS